MKGYKSFAKEFIGESDIACLTVQVCGSDLDVFLLPFGGDGAYDAYIIHGEEVEIGQHYHLFKEVENFGWVKIFDDSGKTFYYFHQDNENTMKIWRAGDYGCIIQFY